MNIGRDMYEEELVRMGMALREARLDAGLSMSEVASRLGVDASTIGKIERGVWNPTVGYLIALAGVYGSKWRLLR